MAMSHAIVETYSSPAPVGLLESPHAYWHGVTAVIEGDVRAGVPRTAFFIMAYIIIPMSWYQMHLGEVCDLFY